MNLKLNNNSDPYGFIGEISGIINSFRELNITADIVLQCILWQNMCARFQTHITNITNKNQPSLDEMMNVIFEAAKRFIKQKDQIQQFSKNKSSESEKPKEKEATNYAANVKKPRNLCSLCKKDGVNDIDHGLRHCKKYSTASARINKLKLKLLVTLNILLNNPNQSIGILLTAMAPFHFAIFVDY